MSLTIENLSFGYIKQKRILKDISFLVERGKTLGVIGISGTGKSTLLKVVADFVEASDKKNLVGDVSFEGSSIKTLKATGKFSFMFQEPTLMPNLNVWENITLPFTILNQPLTASIDKTIRLVGLSNYKEAYPNALSGGMKTRVALARSFITNPELLLLDEPFSSLDIGWKNKLYQELEELQKLNNTTVILVSHDLEEVLHIADSIILIGSEGTIIHQQEVIHNNPTPNEIQKLKQLIIDNYKTITN